MTHVRGQSFSTFFKSVRFCCIHFVRWIMCSWYSVVNGQICVFPLENGALMKQLPERNETEQLCLRKLQTVPKFAATLNYMRIYAARNFGKGEWVFLW